MNYYIGLRKIILEIRKNDRLKQLKTKQYYNNNSYAKKEYLITNTELIFYMKLKQAADELKLLVCPQVSLYEIITCNNKADFNKISRKTIDFVITNQALKILCCIELDDSTHNLPERIERDNFINNLFKQTNIKLIRIPVKQNYNIEEIKKALTAT